MQPKATTGLLDDAGVLHVGGKGRELIARA